MSDIAEKIRDRFRSTVKPSIKNLLSAKRSFIMLFGVMLILETLIGIMLLSVGNSLIIDGEIQEQCAAYTVSADNDTDKSGVVAASLIISNLNEMRNKSTSVFFLALFVWFAASAFIFLRIFSSSVELSKFTYGLYITFGADTKKIRRFISWQIAFTGALSLFAAIPAAILCCLIVYGFADAAFSVSFLGVILMVAAVIVFLIIIIRIVARRTVSKTCVQLLSSSDVSDYSHSPRRSSERLSASSPFGIAFAAVRRLRGYYLTLVISAALPACLFFCCMSLAKSNEVRTEGPVHEYTISFLTGFDPDRYLSDYAGELEAIGNVESVETNVGGTASSIGTNMLLDAKNTSDYRAYSYDFDTATENIDYVLGTANATRRVLGYELVEPGAGFVTVCYPETVYGTFDVPFERTLRVEAGDKILIAVSGADGNVSTLEERVSDKSTSYIVLTVEKVVEIPYERNKSNGNPIKCRISKEYIAINQDDYAYITNGTKENTVEAAAIQSFVAVNGEALTKTGETVPFRPLSAVCDFSVAVNDSLAAHTYGLTGNVPETAEYEVCVLRAPDSVNTYKVGDTIYLSKVNENAKELTLSETEQYMLSNETQLMNFRIEQQGQAYVCLRIVSVIATDGLSGDVLLIGNGTYAGLLGRRAAYTEIYVNVNPNIPVDEVGPLIIDLEQWKQTLLSEDRLVTQTLTSTGKLWDVILTGTHRYNSLVRIFAVLLALSIPFIWFFTQYNHYKKRKYDLEIIIALGQPKKTVRRIFLWEGLITAGLSAVFSVILCPVFAFIVNTVLEALEFPFAYSQSDFTALALVILFSMVCSVLTCLANYLICFGGRGGVREDKK